MGLRDKLKSRVKTAVEKLSGEHSSVAPAVRQDYTRGLDPSDDKEVVMARIKRPPGRGGAKGKK